MLNLTNRALHDLLIDKIAEVGAPIVEIHPDEESPPSVVVIDANHLTAITSLIPRSEEATRLLMDHEHLVGGEDE